MSGRSSASRRRSREVALQVLYALDLGRERGCQPPAPSEEAFERISENFELPSGSREFARELVCGAAARRDELDALLAKHASNWRVGRMAAVDRNILRLAIWELVYTDTPASVVLDEAIELARRFGSEPSPGFVNGVLDAVARRVRPSGAWSASPAEENGPGAGA